MGMDKSKNCFTLAMNYYNKGVEITHPDGWTDGGIGGKIYKAKLLYMNQKWTELDLIMSDLLPSLNNLMDNPRELDRYPLMRYMCSDKNYVESLWGGDVEFHSLLSGRYFRFVNLHLIAVAFYIEAKRNLRSSNVEAALDAKANICKIAKHIRGDHDTRIFKYLITKDIVKNHFKQLSLKTKVVLRGNCLFQAVTLTAIWIGTRLGYWLIDKIIKQNAKKKSDASERNQSAVDIINDHLSVNELSKLQNFINRV